MKVFGILWEFLREWFNSLSLAYDSADLTSIILISLLNESDINVHDLSNKLFQIIFPDLDRFSRNSRGVKQQISPTRNEKLKNQIIKKKEIDQRKIYERANKTSNNLVTRHMQKSCHDLYEFDKKTPLTTKGIHLYRKQYFICYGCNKEITKLHPIYIFSCGICGNLFQKYRHFSKPLPGKVAVVTGSRTKLGHQIVLKLLRAGATVIGTTRFPGESLHMYQKYSDYGVWAANLEVYSKAFDLDVPNIEEISKELGEYIRRKHGVIDILVNCAAQTIRVREKGKQQCKQECNQQCKGKDEALEKEQQGVVPKEQNRYGDAKHVAPEHVNSWQMMLPDLKQQEMEEVYRVNSVAPCLLIQSLSDLMKESKGVPYVINVHAREGQFSVNKSGMHIHTNMAKAALAMLTKCLLASKLKTKDGKAFSIHGCDPGWISVDEYYEDSSPWIVPPLDEIDGAARILYPLFKNIQSCGLTRKQFKQLAY